ncbi:hypothetical protein BDP27DRAFT_1316362 [Rhodocollybia butyracea]|uniref:Uncharacterized protein n=1 Tax=Rhodocollybia butyracea TaxID=206335 RepID=A0A9P5UDC9_9AGAR|nr:hypothetical protein BDP27DRAFT_1316362 [Rhodocollybia butyracea]
MPYNSFPRVPRAPSASTSAAHKLKSLRISPDLDALLKQDELVRLGQEASESLYTNPLPSPIYSQDLANTPKSSHLSIPPLSPYSPLYSGMPGSSSSSTSSYANNWSPPLSRGSVSCHTPDTSIASLSSMVRGEPMLKSLPPPPRPGSGYRPGTAEKRRATDPSSPLIQLGTSEKSPLRSLTAPIFRLELPGSTRRSSAVTQTVAEGDVLTNEVTKLAISEQHGPVERSVSETGTFKLRAKHSFPSSSDSQGPYASAVFCNNDPALIHIASSPRPIHSPVSSVSSPSSSDSSATITPDRCEMGLRTSPIPPIPISQKQPRHALRSPKSAHDTGHRSHGSAPSAGHAPTVKIHSMARGSSRRVLSVEDVLGELFNKEDALDSLRILARTQTGLMDVPLSPERSTSRHNHRHQIRVRGRSTQGTEASFLRMGLEDDASDAEQEGQFRSSNTNSRSTHSVPPAPCICPASSTEVSVMDLDEEHRARHPHSGGIGSEDGRLLRSSDRSFTTKEKQVSSRSSLSYVHVKRKDGYSAALGSRSGSTESCGDVLEQSAVSRSRPAQILISSAADWNAPSSPPTYSNSDASPQLPKVVPPSPLSASFDRSFAFSGYPSSAELDLAVNQLTSGTEEVSFRQNRSSLVTVCSCTESEESCTLSRRPGSFSTLAFGHSTSVKRKKRSRESLDQETVDSESSSRLERLARIRGRSQFGYRVFI